MTKWWLIFVPDLKTNDRATKNWSINKEKFHASEQIMFNNFKQAKQTIFYANKRTIGLKEILPFKFKKLSLWGDERTRGGSTFGPSSKLRNDEIEHKSDKN